jgi:hypothetical protein
MCTLLVSLFVLGNQPDVQYEVRSAIYWNVTRPFKQRFYGNDQTFTPAGFNQGSNVSIWNEVKSPSQVEGGKGCRNDSDSPNHRKGS